MTMDKLFIFSLLGTIVTATSSIIAYYTQSELVLMCEKNTHTNECSSN